MASLIDTSNFDKFDEIDAWHPAMLKTRGENDSQFIGFTYKRNQENERSVLVKALENLEKNKNSNSYRCLNSNNQSVQQKYDSQFNDKKTNQTVLNQNPNCSYLTERKTIQNKLEQIGNAQQQKVCENKNPLPYIFGPQMKDGLKSLTPKF